jgi:hypothetical protein
MKLISNLAFSFSLFFITQAFAVMPVTIKEAKHIIGYVCLKEIQNSECWQPFKIFDKEGNPLPTKVPSPAWAKTLTEETPHEMIDYDVYGFKVLSIEKDRIAIQTSTSSTSSNEPLWIPKDKITNFYPLEEVPFCEFSDKDWAKNLYKADLKTLDKVNSTKTSVGIEVLEKKWVSGQLWLKVKVFEGDRLEESESLGIGSFWVPYSKTITICPKGC